MPVSRKETGILLSNRNQYRLAFFIIGNMCEPQVCKHLSTGFDPVCQILRIVGIRAQRNPGSAQLPVFL